ncbi:uncharacterized protein LOC143368074 [Andrena cerasifolii]|uniref:uncharacterized protein LOC143368074 n=1 Tax=Andrena cerasifolii TaxID=2819439 RepID=UPI004037C7AD
MSEESGIDTTVAGTSHGAITSSDTETDSRSADSFICSPAKKPKRAKRLNRKPFKQAFCKAWLKDPQFQLWLQATEDPYHVKCIICCKYLKAGKTYLQQHANTTTHSVNMKRKAGAAISVPSDAATISIDTSVAGPSDAAIRSSDTETDSSSDTTFVVSAAKKVRSQRQAFRQAWLEDPKFELWLEPVEDNPYKARCRVCSKFLTANTTNLNMHINSGEHYMNIVHKKEALSTGEWNFAQQIKMAEIRICLDAVEHNRSFESYCHFIEMLKKALPSPDILQHISLNENKMKAIVKNDINKSMIAESRERLQGKFVSDIHKIDVEKEDNLLALETMYPELNCLNTLSEIEKRNGEGDNEKITKFDQSAFQDIVKNMPFDKIFLDSLDFLNPVIALDLNRHRKDHLNSILKKFKSKQFNEADVENEWRSVACFSADEDKEELLALNAAQFWHHISSIQNVADGSYNFKNISQLARLCLSLPHSDADVE